MITRFMFPGAERRTQSILKHTACEVKLKLPTVLAGGYSMVALMQAWFGTQDDPRHPVFEQSSADRKTRKRVNPLEPLPR